MLFFRRSVRNSKGHRETAQSVNSSCEPAGQKAMVSMAAGASAKASPHRSSQATNTGRDKAPADRMHYPTGSDALSVASAEGAEHGGLRRTALEDRDGGPGCSAPFGHAAPWIYPVSQRLSFVRLFSKRLQRAQAFLKAKQRRGDFDNTPPR